MNNNCIVTTTTNVPASGQSFDAAYTVITKTNGFDCPLAPFLIRNGVRIYTWCGSHTWTDDPSIKITLRVPQGIEAGIEKYNSEIHCVTPGHEVDWARFAAAIASVGGEAEKEID